MYRVSTASDGADGPVGVKCLTCGTVNADNKECSFNSAEFSLNFGYYVHGCDGPNAPRSVIKHTKVFILI